MSNDSFWNFLNFVGSNLSCLIIYVCGCVNLSKSRQCDNMMMMSRLLLHSGLDVAFLVLLLFCVVELGHDFNTSPPIP